MKNATVIGGALLALAVFVTTAEARMMGGMSMPSTSMSRGDIHTTMPSSLASPRSFSPDGHSFSPDGHKISSDAVSFSPDGLQHKDKGSNWKKPIDADNGGPPDPPPNKQPPQRTTQTATKLDPGGPWYGPGSDFPGRNGHYGQPWQPHHVGHCGARPDC